MLEPKAYIMPAYMTRMRVKYKTKCSRCRTNYVLVTWRNNYPVCYDCQKTDLHQEIKDAKMKKFFDIPEELYKESTFLRDIKLNYLKWGKLTEKQIEAFKTTVKKMSSKPTS
jgi:hypothetical protein